MPANTETHRFWLCPQCRRHVPVGGTSAGAASIVRPHQARCVHEWWGQNEYARNHAKRLAETGYVGFALDMCGGGQVTRHPAEADAQSWTAAMKLLGEVFRSVSTAGKKDSTMPLPAKEVTQ